MDRLMPSNHTLASMFFLISCAGLLYTALQYPIKAYWPALTAEAQQNYDTLAEIRREHAEIKDDHDDITNIAREQVRILERMESSEKNANVTDTILFSALTLMSGWTLKNTRSTAPRR